mmetsp:Transcript_23585/g.60557  ORF Transcript_23585/g.60557 Transcript_23585/m.60557 type:complete len:294 (-) Transcript_23585:8044-8925(-)
MGRVKTEENRCRITPRENSSSADGTTWVMHVLPSASRSASRGVTTVVLPAPMMSWWHSESPEECAAMKRRTSATCCSRRMMSQVYSNMRKRGSKDTAPPDVDAAWWRRVESAPASEVALRNMPLMSASVASGVPALFFAWLRRLMRSSVRPMQRMQWPIRTTVIKLAAARFSANSASFSSKKGLADFISSAPSDEESAAAISLRLSVGDSLADCARLSERDASVLVDPPRGLPLAMFRAASSSALPAVLSCECSSCRSDSSCCRTAAARSAAFGVDTTVAASASVSKHLSTGG